MKIILRLLFIFILTFSTFNINASFIGDIWDTTPIKIDCGWKDCNIKTGIEIIDGKIDNIEDEKPFSVYIQDVIAYLLTFLSIIAVIYIIYAWFRILIWAWDEEVLKKQKATILYVAIGMAVIWLAYPIMLFVIQVLSTT